MFTQLFGASARPRIHLTFKFARGSAINLKQAIQHFIVSPRVWISQIYCAQVLIGSARASLDAIIARDHCFKQLHPRARAVISTALPDVEERGWKNRRDGAGFPRLYPLQNLRSKSLQHRSAGGASLAMDRCDNLPNGRRCWPPVPVRRAGVRITRLSHHYDS